MDERMTVFPGAEVTTIIRGHFNLVPIVPQPGVANGGALQWWTEPMTTSELFARMREVAEEDALLQVNHPRTPGMVAFAGYDPNTGEPGDPDFWSWDFDTLELINGGVDDLHDVREDFFSFLNLGYTPIPVGVSDSHYRFIPCGLGRTDVYLGEDEPSAVTWESYRSALLDGHVVVASGTTLRVRVGDALPGDTLTGTTAALEIDVQTPSWIEPGTLRIYRNGDVLHEQILTERDDDGHWFEDNLEVDSEQDAWFVVEVEGTEPLGDTWRNHTPYAMTNAFFLDVEGDGWDAPGL